MLIGKLARITGLSKDGIRHYEQLGILTSRSRQAGTRMYRDYDESAVETIEKLRQAQQLGFSLREIAPLLKAYADKPPSKAEAVVFLKERLQVVRDKLDTLRGVETFIVNKLRHYDARACPPPKRVGAGGGRGKGSPFGNPGRRGTARP